MDIHVKSVDKDMDVKFHIFMATLKNYLRGITLILRVWPVLHFSQSIYTSSSNSNRNSIRAF